MNIDMPEIAEDGTLDVAISKKHEVRISNQEWFEISLALEPFHAVFYKLWQMGKPIFNEEIETAAVQFDEVGNFSPQKTSTKRLQVDVYILEPLV